MLEGDLAMAQKRYTDAVTHYRKAQTILNNSQLAVGEFNAARLGGESNPDKNLSKWVAANPTDVNAVAALAEYRESVGKPQDARRLYEAALQKEPDNLIMLNNLAMLLASTKDPKSVDYAARAYKAAPRTPGIADTYGWALVQQGRVDEGLPVLRAAADGLPDNAEVQYHLAVALAAKKQNAEAQTLLKKSLAGQLPPAARADAQKLLAQVSK
jgi:Tfp pilus assembly protein PilF